MTKASSKNDGLVVHKIAKKVHVFHKRSHTKLEFTGIENVLV